MRLPDYLNWIRQDVRAAPLFALLNLMGVAATVCAVLVFLALTAGVRELMVDRLTREVDLLTLEVVLENRGGAVPADSVVALAWGSGTRSAIPVHATYGQLVTADGTGEVMAAFESYRPGPLGSTDERLARIPLLAGRYPASGDTSGVWVSETLFSTLFSDTVRIDELDRTGLLYVSVAGDSRVGEGSTQVIPVEVLGILRRTPHDGIVVYAPEPLVMAVKAMGGDGHARPDRVDLVVGNLESLGSAREIMRRERIVTRSVLDRIDSVDKLLLMVRVIFFVVFAVGVVIAVFNVVITLTTYVLQRRREVGVLSALGATRGQVQGIFVLHALLLGATGAVVGTGICLTVIAAARALFAHVDSLQIMAGMFRLSPVHVGSVAAAAVILSLLASILPSRFAAAITPIDTLRSDG